MVAETDWVTEGDSPQRQHEAEVTLIPPLEEAWVYNAGAGFGPVSPLMLGEAVFVATRKGEIHAINLETGKKMGVKGFGDAVQGTPVIEQGMLYVPVAWGGKVLRSYDLELGRDDWTVKHVPIETGLLALDGSLYAVDVESNVRAYDPKTGEVRWLHKLDSLASIHTTPVVAGGDRLIVANDEGVVSALGLSDGTPVWSRDLHTPVYATPTTNGETVFFPTTRGRFFALDATQGATDWMYSVPDTTVRFSSPALAGDELIFGGSDGVLRSLDAQTGKVRWTFIVPDAITAAPLITRETLFFGSMGRILYAVDRETGSLRWEQVLKGRIKSAMAARDGHLVVLTEPRYVYLFRVPTDELVASESE